MGQILPIPELKGNVAVFLSGRCRLPNGAAGPVADFRVDDNLFGENLKLPGGDLAGGAIAVTAQVYFPGVDNKGKNDASFQYNRTISAVFPIKSSDAGGLLFRANELRMTGALPADPKQAAAMRKSQFQLIAAGAVVDASDPRCPAIRVTITVGNPSVITRGKEKQKEGGELAFGLEIGNDDIGKLQLGAGDGKKTKTKSTTIQPHLTQTGEWVLYLDLPPVATPPQPWLFRYQSTLSIYFDTNKAEIGNYRNPADKSDQLKELQKFLDRNLALWGKSIKGVHTHGYASRRGDTGTNLNLGEARAQYVAREITRLSHLPVKVFPRGEPLTDGNDSENSWKDRYVVVGIDIEHEVSPQR